jgi:type VI secretion system protein ImpA
MRLPDNLLSPIPGPSPSGENLYYSALYDKIKEARREEEAISQGEWQRELKKADYSQVIKLTTEALASQTKDLQLAAWLTEALLQQEGFAGLAAGLDLLRGLIENFWDTVFPELEDGDPEFRATPLEWVGSQLDRAVRSVSLTRNRLSWLQYKESRFVPYEADCAENEVKRNAREAAIADGKLTPEQFDEAFDTTPDEYYSSLQTELNEALEALKTLDEICEEKFGDVAPNFGPLRTSLEEVKQTVRVLFGKRAKPEPGSESEAPMIAEESAEIIETPVERSAEVPVHRPIAGEPADQQDAFERVAVLARYLRRESPYSPVPYLLLRSLRWGELERNSTRLCWRRLPLNCGRG